MDPMGFIINPIGFCMNPMGFAVNPMGFIQKSCWIHVIHILLGSESHGIHTEIPRDSCNPHVIETEYKYEIWYIQS
jgi:hypothetical protein